MPGFAHLNAPVAKTAGTVRASGPVAQPIGSKGIETCDTAAACDQLPASELSARPVCSRPVLSSRTRVKPSYTSSPSPRGQGAEDENAQRHVQKRRRSWSRSLTPRQVDHVLRATQFAAFIGLPLNRFVTINWEAAGLPDSCRATGSFLKSVADWLRRNGATTAYVWVQERGHRVGQHVHILLHVPPRLVRRFSRRQRGWLTAAGAKLHKGFIKSRPVGRSYGHSTTPSWEDYHLNLRRVASYLVKEAPVVVGGRGSTSVVRGKRCSTSQNIGVAAWEAEREHEINLVPEVAVRGPEYPWWQVKPQLSTILKIRRQRCSVFFGVFRERMTGSMALGP